MAVLSAVSFVAFSCEKPEDEGGKDNTEQGGDNEGGGTQTALKADFTYEADGLTVKFTNTSEGATAYMWSFGDNTESQEESPEHEYAAGGTYTVKLTVANDDGETAVKEETITVAGAVKANFSFTPQTDRAGKFGKIIDFDATGSLNPASIVWDFGDGTVTEAGQEFTVSHEYAEFNTYTVKATVTGESGDTDTYEAQVEVIPYTELLKGGSMEADDAQYWTIVDYWATVDYAPVEGTRAFVTEFGYTQDGPSAMSGGCLRLGGENQVEDGGYTSVIYQPIELVEGDVLSISADMKWGENTMDDGVLFFSITEDPTYFAADGHDDIAVVQVFNWWNVGTPIPAYDGNLTGTGLADYGYSYSGEDPSVITWVAPSTGTYYFGIDLRSVWGECFGAGKDYFFDNVSVKINLDAAAE